MALTYWVACFRTVRCWWGSGTRCSRPVG